MAKMPTHLLCGHSIQSMQVRGYRGECTHCGSFWDMDFCHQQFRYDDAYPKERHHFDAQVGRMKVKALRRWMAKSHIDLTGKTICEVGFGGAFCLSWLNQHAKTTYGIEAVPANLKQARILGVQAENLFHFQDKPAELPQPVQVWFFLDSFEHILDPEKFCQWVIANSTPKTQILIVLPQAGSTSEKLLGRLWPHKIHDHKFHWSRAGLISFFEEKGIRLKGEFFPLKFVDFRTIMAHLGNKFESNGLRTFGQTWMPRWALPFNFGEMGLTFELTKEKDH